MLHVTTAAISNSAMIVESDDGDLVAVFREGLLSAEALETLRLLANYVQPVGRPALQVVV